MKKALIVSPIPTHPHNTGNRSRVYHFIEELKKLNIEPFFLYMEGAFAVPTEMTTYWEDRLTCVPTELRFGRQKRTLTTRIFKKLRIQPSERMIYTHSLDDFFELKLLDACRDLHRKHCFDFVLCEYIFMSKALTVFPDKTIKIIDTHDRFSDRYKIFPKINGRRAMQWMSTSKRSERAGFNRADRIIAIQEEEARFFRKLTRRPVITVGHLFNAVIVNNDNEIPNKKILFFASNNKMNIDGYHHFVANTWPLIRAALPECELIIAGLICRDIERINGVTYWGEVEDIAAVYSQIALSINPTRYGSGLKIKTIEALIYGKPVVSSINGSIGLEEMLDTCVFATDDPQKTGDIIVRLLTDNAAYRDALAGITRSLKTYRRNTETNMAAVFAPLI